MSAGWTKEPALSTMSSQMTAQTWLRAILRSGPTRSSVPWRCRLLPLTQVALLPPRLARALQDSGCGLSWRLA